MTFQTGTSGNPGGSPRGTGSRQQVFSTLVEPHRGALFEVAIDMALKGNENRAKTWLGVINRQYPAS